MKIKLLIMSLILGFIGFNANSQTAEEWYQQAETALESKDYQKAIEYYEQAIKLEPFFVVEVQSMRLVYYNWNEQQYEKAVKCFEKAIEYKPDDAEVYIFMGNVYAVVKREYAKAIEYYKKAIELNSDDAYTYITMGCTYLESGDEEQAIKCFKKAAELGDEDAKQWLEENGISY